MLDIYFNETPMEWRKAYMEDYKEKYGLYPVEYNPETFEEDFREQRLGQYPSVRIYSLHTRDGRSLLDNVQGYLETKQRVYVYSPEGYAILYRDRGEYTVVKNFEELADEEKEVFANLDLFKNLSSR
jgi:hypothetical protein